MSETANPPAMLKTIGFWMALIMALLQALNALRALGEPFSFAAYMGLPLESPADTGFVGVYGLRAAFIALMIAVLLLKRQLAALSWIALLAIVMPVGDAILVHEAGAPPATVLRHALIAGYLVIAFAFLRRAATRQSR